MKSYYILIGNFGSGKSEIAMNIAINAAKSEKTVMVDLDIINPYFRSAERKDDLEKAGVKLHYPIFALTTVDVPSLPPDIYSVFVGDYETVVFDVGGDPTGATALGQYKPNFENVPPEQLNILYVVNPRRPFAATSEMVLDMLYKIEYCSRLKVTGFINNGNLAVDTSAEDLFAGYELLKEVVDKTGIPVKLTTGVKHVLDEYMEKAVGFEEKYVGNPMEIEILMHRDWDRFTKFGV
ncbi:hypothetical protein LJC27_05940 [Christensenellaceae bacterium OttesenSCG-928-M15]|nr:hypothetical protein [Christensenellaceae bacterium OttesenSCG-928-M15]